MKLPLSIAALALLAAPAMADTEEYCKRHPLASSCAVPVPVSFLSFAEDIAAPREPSARDGGAVGAGGVENSGDGGSSGGSSGGGSGGSSSGGSSGGNSGVGNPGNDKSVGNAGESPNGRDFGGGSRGRSDTR